MDELLEFSRAALDTLREPLVNRSIRLARGGKATLLPADFILVATLNPCPCGQRGFSDCRCTESELQRYWSRLSGPLSDRLDMAIPVYRQAHDDRGHSESSIQLRSRVRDARALIAGSWPHEGGDLIPQLDGRATRPALRLLSNAGRLFELSKRGLNSVVRTAISVASLEGADSVDESHLQEALSYRTGWNRGRAGG